MIGIEHTALNNLGRISFEQKNIRKRSAIFAALWTWPARRKMLLAKPYTLTISR
jgi:hypothetical protein